jgi:hypothetical protein
VYSRAIGAQRVRSERLIGKESTSKLQVPTSFFNRSLAAKVTISFAVNEHTRKIEVKSLTARGISLNVDQDSCILHQFIGAWE